MSDNFKIDNDKSKRIQALRRAQELLGLRNVKGQFSSPSKQEIKDAYRKMAMIYHPDRKNTSNIKDDYKNKHFSELTSAYRLLLSHHHELSATRFKQQVGVHDVYSFSHASYRSAAVFLCVIGFAAGAVNLYYVIRGVKSRMMNYNNDTPVSDQKPDSFHQQLLNDRKKRVELYKRAMQMEK